MFQILSIVPLQTWKGRFTRPHIGEDKESGYDAFFFTNDLFIPQGVDWGRR